MTILDTSYTTSVDAAMGWWKRILLTLSLTATMTGFAVWLCSITMVISEKFMLNKWLGDDDWLWLMLPLGAAIGLGLWLRYRRRPWIHVAGVILVLWFVLETGWILSQEKPPGMQGLGIAIGKAIAEATAYVAAGTGLVSFVIAIGVMALLTWRESRMAKAAARESPN